MASSRHVLKVCVCGAAQDQSTLLLHSLAAGHMLGQEQPLRVLLHDSADKTMELEEQAMDLQDSCYSLLMGVQAERDVCKSLSQADIVLVILNTTELAEMVTEIGGYAGALNKVPRTKQKAVVVVGQHALTAAGVLHILAPHLSSHLVTAAKSPLRFHGCSQGGTYIGTKAISEHVNSWWTKLQERDELMTHESSYNCPSILTSYFLPQPIRTHTQQPLMISPSASSDWEHVRKALEELNDVAQQLGISEAELLSKAVHCHL